MSISLQRKIDVCGRALEHLKATARTVTMALGSSAQTENVSMAVIRCEEAKGQLERIQKVLMGNDPDAVTELSDEGPADETKGGAA